MIRSPSSYPVVPDVSTEQQASKPARKRVGGRSGEDREEEHERDSPDHVDQLLTILDPGVPVETSTLGFFFFLFIYLIIYVFNHYHYYKKIFFSLSPPLL